MIVGCGDFNRDRTDIRFRWSAGQLARSRVETQPSWQVGNAVQSRRKRKCVSGVAVCERIGHVEIERTSSSNLCVGDRLSCRSVVEELDLDRCRIGQGRRGVIGDFDRQIEDQRTRESGQIADGYLAS